MQRWSLMKVQYMLHQIEATTGRLLYRRLFQLLLIGELVSECYPHNMPSMLNKYLVFIQDLSIFFVLSFITHLYFLIDFSFIYKEGGAPSPLSSF